MYETMVNNYTELFNFWTSDLDEETLTYSEDAFENYQLDIDFYTCLGTYKEMLSDEGVEYLKDVSKLSWKEQIYEYLNQGFYYCSFFHCRHTGMTAKAFTVSTGIDVTISQEEKEVIRDITQLPATDKILLHQYFVDDVLPSTGMGCFYFDSAGLFANLIKGTIEALELGIPTFHIYGDKGSGKSHFHQVIADFVMRTGTELPHVEFFDEVPNDISKRVRIINGKKKSKELDVDELIAEVYLPSLFEMIEGADLPPLSLPLPVAARIDAVIERYVKDEMRFYGTTRENHQLWKLRFITQKCRMWELVQNNTRFLKLINVDWPENYISLYQYIFAGLTMHEWAHASKAIDDIRKMSEFSFSVFNPEKHESYRVEYKEYKNTHSREETFLMMLAKVSSALSWDDKLALIDVHSESLTSWKNIQGQIRKLINEKPSALSSKKKQQRTILKEIVDYFNLNLK